MRSARNFRQSLLAIIVVLASLAIGLFIADIVLKKLRLPKESDRVMLLSGSSLSTDQYGVRRYEPSKLVEQAGYIDSKLAYRYKYQTNNLGFVSKYDYEPGEKLDLVITGDSMTEGQEVGSWLAEFQRHLFTDYRITSQNTAIAGNGFIEFEKATSYARSSLNAKKAMLVFIPDDMFRFGDVMAANQNCSTYKQYSSAEIDCDSGRPTWHHYPQDISDKELAAYAESKTRFGLFRTLKKPALDATKMAIHMLCKTGMRMDPSSALANRINGECDASTASNRVPEANAQPIPVVTVAAIRKILQTYGVDNVLMVMIPGGGYSFKKLQPQVNLGKVFEGEFPLKLKFVDISESCELPPELWGGVGRHPSAKGYLKLQSCFLANKEILDFATR